MEKNFFESKIKPILLYVGTIGAVAMSIGYIILMFVLVIGFKVSTNFSSSIMFAVVNAIVGFVIMQFLKIQGFDFAKQLPDNIEIMKEWNKNHKKIKQKKHHSMTYFWIKTMITDGLFKALTIAITTAGIIYIVIEGSQDYNMLLLSLVNLIMFACFGLISLVRAYEYYNNEYIPYIEDRMVEEKYEDQKQKTNSMDNATKEIIQEEKETC